VSRSGLESVYGGMGFTVITIKSFCMINNVRVRIIFIFGDIGDMRACGKISGTRRPHVELEFVSTRK